MTFVDVNLLDRVIVGAEALLLGLGAVIGATIATVIERRNLRDTRTALEATIRTLENQLSKLADYAAGIERELASIPPELVKYAKSLSASQNTQPQSFNPVPLPQFGQAVENPQSPGEAQNERSTEK